ncbi:RNA methyltransferase [Henriciella barbarensis]|uniref:RNA methyltransferase n=1 Tax=Henriciella barbarensis TaxID=86342 RepID=A0A399R026_9PROT|nr:RNA methyltransferase [Henriciella barbarensis]RIJ24273.1 RNA methyltransferase [Henriciella barbarensis]
MRTVPISDADDPRVAPYVSIRERDLAGRSDGRFIVEGKVTLSILLERSRFEIESVFIGRSRLEPLSEILAQVPPEVPVYVAPQAVMDQVAGFPIHRGVLACARKGQPFGVEKLLDAETLLVLNGISNHDNVGAAFRNAAAFGAGGVLLDEQSCDPLYRKSIRVSAGAALWLPFVQAGQGEDHITGLQSAGFDIWAMTPRTTAAELHQLKPSAKTAILLGPEGPGLEDALIDRCRPVRIAMAGGFDSINVATAGAIALAYCHATSMAGDD